MGWPGPMTYRQEGAWDAFLLAELNEPSQESSYIMGLSAEVRRGHVAEPGGVRPDHFKLTFGPADPLPPDEEFQKQMFVGMAGGDDLLTRRTRPRAEAVAMGLLPPDQPEDG